eukprot:5928712-Prymnesium_polylepis.1
MHQLFVPCRAPCRSRTAQHAQDGATVVRMAAFPRCPHCCDTLGYTAILVGRRSSARGCCCGASPTSRSSRRRARRWSCDAWSLTL